MLVEPPDYVVNVWAVDGLRLTSAPVRIVYRDFAGVHGGERPTIVLLHGSPGRKEEFDNLAPILARSGRVVVPDLPGFGSSTRALPDYSSRAHALYVRQLLDCLGVQRVHVLGYSMGGGVALSFADLAPERLASLTMLSAVGVQEMELTGDYYANHAVHGAQLGALWLLREGTPHMGLLDDMMLGVPYARNFYDSDQRPLRAALAHLVAPMLIIHGLDDPQVPIEAAREHWRLVAQSELITLPGNHFLLFSDTAFLGSAIADFVRRAATGRAPARNDADPERVGLAAAPFDPMTLPRVRGIRSRRLRRRAGRGCVARERRGERGRGYVRCARAHHSRYRPDRLPGRRGGRRRYQVHPCSRHWTRLPGLQLFRVGDAERRVPQPVCHRQFSTPECHSTASGQSLHASGHRDRVGRRVTSGASGCGNRPQASHAGL